MNSFFPHSYWTRRQALRFIAGAVGGIGLHGCSTAAKSHFGNITANVTPVTFAVTSWIGNTAIYIAEEKGFFQQKGLKLTVRSFSTVSDSFPAFSIGQIQGAAPVTSEAVSLAADGADYRIVAVMDTSTGGDAFLARNNVTGIQDFKGKRIAVQRGDLGHFFLLQVLAEAGLSEQDVTIIDTSPDAGTTAYIAGNIDIAYAYAPYLQEANAAQTDGRIIFDSSMMPTAIADYYTFNTQFIEENPQAVEAFVGSIFEALDFLKNNRNEAIALAAKHLGVEPEELDVQFNGITLPDLKTNVELLSNPQSPSHLLKPMTAMAEFLKAQGQISAVPNMSEYIEPRFVTALYDKANPNG